MLQSIFVHMCMMDIKKAISFPFKVYVCGDSTEFIPQRRQLREKVGRRDTSSFRS